LTEGDQDGHREGDLDGSAVGLAVTGLCVGFRDGEADGFNTGDKVVGCGVGNVGEADGEFVASTTSERYIGA